MRTRGWGPWRSDFYSLCSRHRGGREDCPQCNAGQWSNRIVHRIDGRIHRHLPKFWLWWHNRPNSKLVRLLDRDPQVASKHRQPHRRREIFAFSLHVHLLLGSERTFQVCAAPQIEILGYTSSTQWWVDSSPTPWFCFNIGHLKYAIWRETGALYEVDEFGAVADDPISGPRAPRGF